MKKTFATIAATGMLSLAAIAGTAGTANAATTHAASPNWSGYYGPFDTAHDCEVFVAAVGEWGVFDCEPGSVVGTWGWVALVP